MAGSSGPDSVDDSRAVDAFPSLLLQLQAEWRSIQQAIASGDHPPINRS
jgi:hypothetical protein